MNISYFIKEVRINEIWPLAEIKNYLRISHNYDGILIASSVEAATIAAEKFTGLCFNHKLIECNIRSTARDLTLKYLPVLNINEVTLIKSQERVIITNQFSPANIANDQINIKDEFIGEDLEIRYTAGYRELPKTLKHAILMHVALMYDSPNDGHRLAPAICDLYQPYRIVKIYSRGG